MRKKRGMLVYVPIEVEVELNETKRDMRIKSNAEAFRQIINNARIGKAMKKTSKEAENLFRNIRI